LLFPTLIGKDRVGVCAAVGEPDERVSAGVHERWVYRSPERLEVTFSGRRVVNATSTGK
jgi:hypothetical protein